MSRHEREREGAGGPLAARHAASESGQDAAARGQHGRACTPLRGAHRTREAAGAAAQRLEEMRRLLVAAHLHNLHRVRRAQLAGAHALPVPR